MIYQQKFVMYIGKSQEEAKKSIEALGLKVEIKTKENKDKKDGIVLEQSVKKDTEIEKGKTVTITINKKQSANTNTVNTNTVNTNTVNTNTVNANTVNANTVNANTVNTNTASTNTTTD